MKFSNTNTPAGSSFQPPASGSIAKLIPDSWDRHSPARWKFLRYQTEKCQKAGVTK